MSFAIRFENVSFVYPKKKTFALEKVSFAVEENSFFALLGANGAGKTTLLRLLCHRLPLENGSISYSDSLQKNQKLDPEQLGILLENPGAYTQLSVHEYLTFFASLYGKKEYATKGEKILETLGFSESMAIRVGKLSLGNKQKLQVARAMQHSPKCLLLDEPAANLDPVSREILWEMLAEWRKINQGTLIVCSHILPELEKYATDYAILESGKLCDSGKISLDSLRDTSFFEIPTQEKEKAFEILKGAGIAVKEAQGNNLGILDKAYRKVYSNRKKD